MSSVVLEKFRLYVPSTDIARRIFNEGLGLAIRKKKVLDNGIGSISFRLSDGATLFCLEHDVKREDLNAYSNSINLFADIKEIQKAYEFLKDADFNVKLSKLSIDSREYLQLHVATKSPSTFVTVSER